MSAEIVSPFGTSAAPTANGAVVERLKDLLAQAERGEINGLVWGATRPTGGLHFGCSPGASNGNLLVAAACMAWHDVMVATNEVAS